MTDAEDGAPAQEDEPSLIALALRVLRGELTEAQAIALVRPHTAEGHLERKDSDEG